MSRGNTLVVVESPAKAKTIKKYLGASYHVLASKGHVWDLPKKFGIDIEKGFQETYEVIEGKEKTLEELKKAAKEADAIMLATDPDREGEAIAFHLAQALKGAKKPTRRVLFQEITKRGVKEGIEHPRDLDKNLYDAQRSRRVLDRIVGYDVSSLVWSKLAFGLSAGRVQSVALRLIVDREREIEAFKPEEYWNLAAKLLGSQKPAFTARLQQWDGKPIAKNTVADEATARRIEADLKGASYKIVKVQKSERQRKAPAPYTTSKLQQDAANLLRFPAKRTMQVAQGLYEGVELGKELGSVGLITYMRTDSTRVSDDAVTAVRSFIGDTFGKRHLPASANVFRSKKNTQDAHEAIRPTSLELPPAAVKKYLKPEQFKLYALIWNRFVASQMAPAVYDQTAVDIEASSKNAKVPYLLRASGRVLKFGGWLDVYAKHEKDEEVVDGTKLAVEEEPATGEEGESLPAARERERQEDEDSAELPPLAEGEVLSLVNPPGVSAEQKFTQPPPRYNEGSLVRALEERGIGRPSTYAEIISKVQARDYVEKPDGRTFRPTDLGKMIVDGLVDAALDFIDPDFTAKMEEELDLVESGKLPRETLLKSFYTRFKKQLDAAKKLKRWTPESTPTNEACTLCGKPMLKKWSKRGWFLSCSDYPKCKGTKPLAVNEKGEVVQVAPVLTDYLCDKCGRPMAIRSGRYGQFLSCTGYPECKNAQPVPLGVKCPKCKTGDLIEVRPQKRGGRTFYGCSNYKDETIKCDFKLWAKPFASECPDCHAPFLTRGGTKVKPMIVCVTEGCGYKRTPTPEDLGTSGEQLAAGEESESSFEGASA